MAFASDDYVIVDHHPQQPPRLGNALGDLDVGTARLGRAGGMIMDQDQRAGAQVERLADHFARVDRGFVDTAVADMVIEDQAVLDVEIKPRTRSTVRCAMSIVR